jgi:hypothetical protein
MAETLGSLCDKLTIVKLKQYHSDNPERLMSLAEQEQLLKREIDDFASNAINGKVDINRLVFSSNKVYKKEGNQTRSFSGNFGELFAELANINCQLWHEQEKVFEFEKVSVEEKDVVIKQLAILNLERNKCIDAIDKSFQNAIMQSK